VSVDAFSPIARAAGTSPPAIGNSTGIARVTGERRAACHRRLTRTESLIGFCGLLAIGLIGAIYDLVERFH